MPPPPGPASTHRAARASRASTKPKDLREAKEAEDPEKAHGQEEEKGEGDGDEEGETGGAALGPARPARAAQMDDAVFGANAGYRAVSWRGACVLMVKSNVGLGVLSLPHVMQTLGLIPGIVMIVTVLAIVTWANYQIGAFKLRHPEVYALSDAGALLWGPWGGHVLGVVFCLYMVFVSGSAILAVSTALNAVSGHGACTAVFVAAAALAGLGCASLPTLAQIAWLGWVGVASIVASIVTLTVAVGLQERPAAAPAAPAPWALEVRLFGAPSLAEAMTAVGMILFSAAATPTLFGIVSEMRRPREFPKALLVAQAAVTVFYAVIASVVYAFCGQYVSSPALGSAGPLFKKISYALALPAVLVSLTLYTHIPAKYVFVRVLRSRPAWKRHIAEGTPTHWAVWLACTAGSTLVAYVIASGIPVFGSLISFIGAVFGPTVCLIPYMFMWFYDHPDWREHGWGGRLTAAWCAFVVLAGLFLTVAGTYGSVLDLMAAVADKPWSCADNSNSV